MPTQVETSSGSTYVFESDGSRLLERRSSHSVQGAPPNYLNDLPVDVQHYIWPPVVGRGLVFKVQEDPEPVSTSMVIGVSET